MSSSSWTVISRNIAAAATHSDKPAKFKETNCVYFTHLSEISLSIDKLSVYRRKARNFEPRLHQSLWFFTIFDLLEPYAVLRVHVLGL